MEIRILSDEEQEKYKLMIAAENWKCQRMEAIKSEVRGALRYIVFTPFAIAANVMSLLLKIVGCVLSIGLPYGLYMLYRAICAGINGTEVVGSCAVPIILFLVIPFIAMFASWVCAKVADCLDRC